VPIRFPRVLLAYFSGRKLMKLRFALRSLTLLLALCTAALASTTWYVDGARGDDNNDCKSRQHACKTIGHAISLASSGDSVMVAPATYTENLTISISLKVIGSSAKTTIIDGGGVNTVVTISKKNAHVTLSQVTIRNGLAASGGGIYNSGTLTVIEGTLTENEASIRCATDCGAKGGGIYNSGTLTVIDSTLNGNEASTQCTQICTARGGGIENEGTLTIRNSTLSENGTVGNCINCASQGGGIATFGTVAINNTTISRNSAAFTHCSGLCLHDGGGIYNDKVSGTTTLQNSIAAKSPSGGNCSGTMTSNGYNLSSDNTCNFNNSGDLNNADPKLGPLQNNGGPTQTQALLDGSPAIDAGNPSGCTDGKGHLLKTDQRGKPRPDKEDTGGCDMGAYERQKD
jgi:hypothetical protein